MVNKWTPFVAGCVCQRGRPVSFGTDCIQYQCIFLATLLSLLVVARSSQGKERAGHMKAEHSSLHLTNKLSHFKSVAKMPGQFLIFCARCCKTARQITLSLACLLFPPGIESFCSQPCGQKAMALGLSKVVGKKVFSFFYLSKKTNTAI